MSLDDDVIPPETPAKASNTAATVALVLGLLSFCTVGITALPAVIVGIIALTKPGGKGLAIGGIVSGVAAMLLSCIALPIALILPATNKVREAAERMNVQNNYKQASLAAWGHESAYGQFPKADRKTAQGDPGLSWRVDLLPYIEQDYLYRRLPPLWNAAGQEKPWNSPEYAFLGETAIKIYRYPNQPAGVETTMRAFVGPGTAFTSKLGNQPRRMSEFTDGASKRSSSRSRPRQCRGRRRTRCASTRRARCRSWGDTSPAWPSSASRTAACGRSTPRSSSPKR
jgi:hypothetical protein